MCWSSSLKGAWVFGNGEKIMRFCEFFKETLELSQDSKRSSMFGAIAIFHEHKVFLSFVKDMVNGFFWGNAYLAYDKLLLSRPGSQVCTSLPQKYLHEFTICIQMYAAQTIQNSREKPLYTDLIMLGGN